MATWGRMPSSTITTQSSAPRTRTMTTAWTSVQSSVKVRSGRQGDKVWGRSTAENKQLTTAVLWLWRSLCRQLYTISQLQPREPSQPHLFLMPGGYWYNCCTDSNLNGVYYRLGEHKKHMDGITWYGWHGANYSLKRVEMKIRPEVFKP